MAYRQAIVRLTDKRNIPRDAIGLADNLERVCRVAGGPALVRYNFNFYYNLGDPRFEDHIALRFGPVNDEHASIMKRPVSMMDRVTDTFRRRSRWRAIARERRSPSAFSTFQTASMTPLTMPRIRQTFARFVSRRRRLHLFAFSWVLIPA